MKRFIVALVLVLIGTYAFASGQQAEASVEKEGPVEITYYMWDDPTYIQIVETFNASQNDVIVNMQVVPASDYEVKLLTILAGGVEVDAYMQKRQTDMFPQFSNGYIEPLDSLISEQNYDMDGLSSYNSAIKVDGKTLAIPFRGASWYTYYNKKLFADAGVPLPNTYIEKGEWTWDKYSEVARKISTLGDDTYGGLFYTWGNCQVVPALQDGVDFISKEGKIDLKDSVLKSFQLRKSLEDDSTIMSLFDLKVTKTHYSTAFLSGKVGMLIIGEWFPGQLMNAKKEGLFHGFTWDDWGVTRLPSDTPDYRTSANPTFNHVHADSKKKDAAFKFISWMGGEEGAVEVAKAGFLPSRINKGVEEALAAAIPDDESFKYFTESPKVMPQFYNKYGTRVEQAVGEMMERYLLNDFKYDSDFVNQFNEVLEDIVATTD